MTEEPGWTLEELTRRAALALSAGAWPDGDGSSLVRLVDSRARSAPDQRVPDQRMVRWYTSIGLVDRPAGGRGRGARYGIRHLSQLVAIKRLQATGLTLADVQARLLGADDQTLRAWADLPQAALAALAVLATAPPPAGSAGSAGSASAASAAGSVGAIGAAGAAGSAGSAEAARAGRADLRFWVPGAAPVEATGVPAAARHRPLPRAQPLGGLRLADGVLLVLPRQPSSADLSVLAEAAVPLMAALIQLGFVLDPSPPTVDVTPGAPR